MSVSTPVPILSAVALAVMASFTPAQGQAPESARPAAAQALQDQDKVKLDEKAIRYGKAADFDPAKNSKVGTVRSTDVYNEIPAYQTIIKEKVDEGSARWLQLMREATQAYRGALEKVAGTDYVLIVEEGGISGYPAADLTATIIQALK